MSSVDHHEYRACLLCGDRYVAPVFTDGSAPQFCCPLHEEWWAVIQQRKGEQTKCA